MGKRTRLIMSLLSFWLFLILFKFGAGLHYALNSPLGARVLPLWAVGLLMAGGSLIQLLMDVPAGHLLDRFGYKRMLAFGTFIAIIGGIVLFWGITAVSIVLSVILVTVGWLFFSPGINAYSLSEAKRSNSVMFMAFRDISGSIGIVLSCVLLPFVVDASSQVISLTIVALISLAFIAILLAPRERRKITLRTSPHERTHHQRRFVLKNLSKSIKRLNPASTILIMLNCAGAIFYGVIWFVIPLVIASQVYNGALLGVGLAMFDFSIVILGSFLIGIVEQRDKKIMIFIGMLIFSLAGFLLGLSFGILFLVFAFLSTAGDETASLPLWAWLHELDEKHNKDGMISGVLNLFSDLGWAIGPLFAGIVYTFTGPTMTIVIGAIPIFAVLVIYYAIVQKHVIQVSVFNAPRRPHKQRHRP